MTAKPYDPTLKELVETEPESWPALLGRPTGPTEVIDADIATVSGAADKVLRVAADPPYLLHLEFVTGHDASALPRKLIVRNALLEDRHDLPVRSGVLLLHPQADSPQLTGRYERGFPDEEAYGPRQKICYTSLPSRRCWLTTEGCRKQSTQPTKSGSGRSRPCRGACQSPMSPKPTRSTVRPSTAGSLDTARWAVRRDWHAFTAVVAPANFRR